MQDEQNNEALDFDLIKFIRQSLVFLRRTYWLVVLAAGLGALALGLYTQQTYVPMYSCRAVLSVNVNNNSITDIISSTTDSNAATTSQVVKTFQTIIEADSMRDRILSKLDRTTIPAKITPAVIAESNLFTITVTGENAQDTYDVLQAVLDCYPDMAFLVIGAARIELIEEPTLPTEPMSKLNVLTPALLGAAILGGIMLLLLCFLAQSQRTIVSAEEMKSITSLPCIVHIPRIDPKRRTRKRFSLNLMNHNVPASYEESIRVMRSRVLEQIKKEKCKRILVTSTAPGEGKSTIAANLALSLSNSGLRVILVDADLRTQETRSFFNIEEPGRGLADLLKIGKADDTVSCLISIPDTKLRILCGTSIARPISLLRRSKIKDIMDRLEPEADLIIIDTPPIGLLADASAFAQSTDCALYVVRAGSVNSIRIADGLQMVRDCQTKLLGYVLNGVSERSGRTYGYGYGYRHSYYGGYGYGNHNYGYGYGSYGYGGYGSYESHDDSEDHEDVESSKQHKSDKSHKSQSGYGGYGGYGRYGRYGSYGTYRIKQEPEKQDEKEPKKQKKQKKVTEAQPEQQLAQSKAVQSEKPEPEPEKRTAKASAASEKQASSRKDGAHHSHHRQHHSGHDSSSGSSK